MNRVGQVGERFYGVELILEFATTLNLGKVLCFIDEKCSGPAMSKRIFECVADFEAHSPWIQSEPARAVSEYTPNLIANLAVNQRFFQGKESAPIVILPTELGAIRRSLNADDGNAFQVVSQRRQKRLFDVPLNPESESSFSDASGSVNKD
jgi:hypothetical protein